MNPAKHEDPLEDLLSSALIEHSNTVKSKRAISTHKHADANYRACFTKPENWYLRSQTRLIHVEGSLRTLLGLFDELVHSYVPGCRRLVAASHVREDTPQKSEEVYGSHWTPSQRLEFKLRPSERTLEIAADLTLDMGQHLVASAVLCKVHLVGGGLQRLCLMQDTVFEGSAPRTILQLPEGIDVLEGMLGACKIQVWKQILKEELKDAPA